MAARSGVLRLDPRLTPSAGDAAALTQSSRRKQTANPLEGAMGAAPVTESAKLNKLETAPPQSWAQPGTRWQPLPNCHVAIFGSYTGSWHTRRVAGCKTRVKPFRLHPSTSVFLRRSWLSISQYLFFQITVDPTMRLAGLHTVCIPGTRQFSLSKAARSARRWHSPSPSQGLLWRSRHPLLFPCASPHSCHRLGASTAVAIH